MRKNCGKIFPWFFNISFFVQVLPASWGTFRKHFPTTFPVLTCVLIFRAGGWGVVQTPLHGMPGDKAERHQPRGAWPTGCRRAAGTERWVTAYFSTVSGGLTSEWSSLMSENVHALKSLMIWLLMINKFLWKSHRQKNEQNKLEVMGGL